MISKVKERAVFVDALRGIAALSVVWFHVYKKTLYAPISSPRLPEPFHAYLHHADVGVAVFFVISGFAIAASVQGSAISASFVGRFVLRRSIRLDPPYWATIALELVLIAVSRELMHERTSEYPSAPQVVSHLIYSQSFFGYGHIVAVFWTLCVEIQLYLAFVLLLAIVQRLPVRFGTIAIFAPMLLLSLVAPYYSDALAQNTFLIRYWYLFFGGVLAYWTVYAELHSGWLLTYICALSLSLATPMQNLSTAIAIVTTCLIWHAGNRAKLTVWLSGSVFQWLGRISYSLYLVHLPISGRAINFATHAIRLPAGRGGQLCLLAIGTGASLVAAQVLYKVVEKPSLALSRRIRKAASP